MNKAEFVRFFSRHKGHCFRQCILDLNLYIILELLRAVLLLPACTELDAPEEIGLVQNSQVLIEGPMELLALDGWVRHADQSNWSRFALHDRALDACSYFAEAPDMAAIAKWIRGLQRS